MFLHKFTNAFIRQWQQTQNAITSNSIRPAARQQNDDSPVPEVPGDNRLPTCVYSGAGLNPGDDRPIAFKSYAVFFLFVVFFFVLKHDPNNIAWWFF
jgi:hypothetical protein